MSREALLGAGALVYGAVFLVGVMAVGAVHSAPVAVYAALCAAGVSYLSYFSQLAFPDDKQINTGLVFGSIALGAFSGLLLLAGV
jgi:hypothetical protein